MKPNYLRMPLTAAVAVCLIASSSAASMADVPQTTPVDAVSQDSGSTGPGMSEADLATQGLTKADAVLDAAERKLAAAVASWSVSNSDARTFRENLLTASDTPS